MSGLMSVIFAAIGVAVGAMLTGLLSIRQTRQKRKQERRAEVYVDVLAWIWTRMPSLQGRLLPGGLELDVENHWPVDAPDFPAAKKKITLPAPEAILSAHCTDPESPFFVSLRSRVAVFASHDMARAFDRWVAAYKLILAAADGSFEKHSQKPDEACLDECVRCALLALVANGVSGTSMPTLSEWIKGRVGSRKKTENRVSEISAKPYKNSIRLRDIFGGEWDNLDGMPGCLTKAVAACASEELRKG